MKYEPIYDGPHPVMPGRRIIYRFQNGFGASVVRFMLPSLSGPTLGEATDRYGSYTDNELEWEVGVTKQNADGSWDITYESGLTDDVIGHVHDDDLESLLDKIAALPGGTDADEEKP